MLVDVCQDAGFLVRITVNLVKILHYVIPMLLIVLIVFDLFKAFNSQLDDKAKKDATNKAIKRTIYAVIVLLIPTIIVFVFEIISGVITPDDHLATNSTSWLDCWVALYNGKEIAGYEGTIFTPSRTSPPTPTISPTPVFSTTPLPGPPEISNVYVYHAYNHANKNPSEENRVVWNSSWGYHIGIHVDFNENTTRIAYAGASTLSEVQNLQLSDFNIKCDIGIGVSGYVIPKIEENKEKRYTRCIHMTDELTDIDESKSNKYQNATGNLAFDLDELDEYRNKIDSKYHDRNSHPDMEADYYLAIRGVNSAGEMTDPVIYKIHMDGSVEQANWTVDRVTN